MQTKIKRNALIIFGFSVLTLFGIIALILRIISFGYLLGFNRKHLIPFTSKLLLKIINVELKLPDEPAFDKNQQYFITFNHNSGLDIFALTALGHSNVSFLLSEKTLKIIPLTILALSIGIIYIPEQHHIERRLNFFKRLERMAKEKRMTIGGASEGVHDQFHGLARFNNGVYHFATVCKLNIIPYFISTPENKSGFQGYSKEMSIRYIYVERMEMINTQDWKLEDLEENKNAVRQIFVNKFNQVHNENIK